MEKIQSERRQIENEVVFRQANERVQTELDKLKEIAEEEKDKSLPELENLTFHFFCECSDENCLQKIEIKLSIYNEIHNNRKQFIIKPKHDVSKIENIILKDTNYWVVEKHLQPPERAARLHITNVLNVPLVES